MEPTPGRRQDEPRCPRCGHFLYFAGFWDGVDKKGHLCHGFLYRCGHCGNELIDKD